MSDRDIKDIQEKVWKYIQAKSAEDNIFYLNLESAVKRNTERAIEEYSFIFRRYRAVTDSLHQVLLRQLSESYQRAEIQNKIAKRRHRNPYPKTQEQIQKDALLHNCNQQLINYQKYLSELAQLRKSQEQTDQIDAQKDN